MAEGRLDTEEVLREIMKAAGGPAAFAQEVWLLAKESKAETVKARILVSVLQLMDRHSEKGDDDEDKGYEELIEEGRKMMGDNGDT